MKIPIILTCADWGRIIDRNCCTTCHNEFDLEDYNEMEIEHKNKDRIIAISMICCNFSNYVRNVPRKTLALAINKKRNTPNHEFEEKP